MPADSRLAPWGLSRMKPYPPAAVLPRVGVLLDPDTQTAQWIGEDGAPLPASARHKRSETANETKTKTSSDGIPDEGHDQSGDTD
ncbi:putative ATP-grasp-modified RiPP [Streptomyces sp. DSM 42041]|uniref:ATP-grasp-modified RiPP n=1 Tax=Streptomyces hazeniae TaxID=3075538 RepID=A0ABU2NP73_9ACTN|nr:putative ATP-grasp-modified RiPP [Streptomyces sp. DSM 42041]MDT0378396.1 putative ATP-grasp-modified RiPP [Streptomyces sp. DSM 42041]